MIWTKVWCVGLFCAIATFAVGMHNIDNAWNGTRMHASGDCAMTVCMTLEEVYMLGVFMAFMGCFMIFMLALFFPRRRNDMVDEWA